LLLSLHCHSQQSRVNKRQSTLTSFNFTFFCQFMKIGWREALFSCGSSQMTFSIQTFHNLSGDLYWVDFSLNVFLWFREDLAWDCFDCCCSDHTLIIDLMNWRVPTQCLTMMSALG
jgi:hypothetical protein